MVNSLLDNPGETVDSDLRWAYNVLPPIQEGVPLSAGRHALLDGDFNPWIMWPHGPGISLLGCNAAKPMLRHMPGSCQNAEISDSNNSDKK